MELMKKTSQFSIWKCFAYLFLILNFVNFLSAYEVSSDYSGILDHIRSEANESVQTKAARDVINRIISIEKATKLFTIHVNKSLPRNTFHIWKTNNKETTVQIIGSTGVAACKGFYYYLKYYLNCHISWDGDELMNLPETTKQLPTVDIQITSSSYFIYYQNVCTYSYSFVWWKWSTNWRRHIDWMALNGITLTLSPAQESVWYDIYTELGLTKNEIDEHFVGPAFMSWQRMGNMRGFGGPLNRSFMVKSFNLQKKINQQLLDLGIVIALPAFAGHAPIGFKRLFPNASLTPATKWNNFPNDYCCPLFIDPIDPLFQQIGQMFLRKILHEYGGSGNHLYFSDPFNEMVPNLRTAEYLSNASRAIFNCMNTVDGKAVWLLQGWMFRKNNNFWTNDLIKSFLTSSIPLGRILVLDLMSENDPVYLHTDSYFGQPFIWCMLHNFGGTLGMHGSMDIVNKRIIEAKNMTNSTMYGVGITPEGINQNYLMYEFTLEFGWLNETMSILPPTDWVKHFIFVRYGKLNDFTEKSWEKLRKTVYSYSGENPLRGKYIVCRRPSLKLKRQIWYNQTIFNTAWNDLLKASDIFQNSKLYQRDLVDITRQYFQNKIEDLYIQLLESFNKKNLTELMNVSTCMADAITDMDRILSTNSDFLLGNWLESAKSLGESLSEIQQFEYNARNQITIWGPDKQILDYAMKQWSGLIEDYCLPRWLLFFSQLSDSLISGRKFNASLFQKTVFKNIEEPFTVDRKIYPTKAISNKTISLSWDLYSKWIN